jgi:hypothetical protein
MKIFRVRKTKILNLKSARLLLLTLFECAARAKFCENSLKLGGVGTYGSEDRRIFSELCRISAILDYGFCVRAS